MKLTFKVHNLIEINDFTIKKHELMVEWLKGCMNKLMGGMEEERK